MLDQGVKAYRKKIERCESADLVKVFREFQEVVNACMKILDHNRPRYQAAARKLLGGQTPEVLTPHAEDFDPLD